MNNCPNFVWSYAICMSKQDLTPEESIYILYRNKVGKLKSHGRIAQICGFKNH